MIESESAPTIGAVKRTEPPRLLYIDNLRWSLIMLVVSMHAAVTYSTVGSWYYTEREAISTPVLFVFVTYQAYLQAFFMALLFFIAGYFVPAAFDRKGGRAFLRDRAYRLGLPVLLYMFVIGPLTEYYLARSWRPSEPSSFATEWIKHIRNGEVLGETGPLWFCLALLTFSTAYSGVRLIPRSRSMQRPLAFPHTLQLLLFALLIATATFLVRLVQPAGTAFFNMQLANFSQYVALFIAGIFARRGEWLMKIPHGIGMRWLSAALGGGFVFWVLILAAGGAFRGNAATYSGRWHWQAAAFDVWESFVCVGLCLGLLVLYREKYNRQGTVAKFLSKNAFSVYVFHPPVVIGAALILHGASWPPLVKFLLVTFSGISITYAASAAVFRKLPGLRAIL